MPHELTLEMGGAGGEFSPPLEAPQGAGHQLTAATVTPENHINWSPRTPDSACHMNWTLEMGGAGGEFSPPLEAPQGAGHQLTAATVTPENHINWSPL